MRFCTLNENPTAAYLNIFFNHLIPEIATNVFFKEIKYWGGLENLIKKCMAVDQTKNISFSNMLDKIYNGVFILRY